MATLILSAAGAAVGASIGGGVLGLSSVLIGRAVGATVGQAIDRRLMSRSMGSGPVESGRIERFRLNGASEGAPVAETYGRVRVGGQVIWASRFLETVNKRQVQSGAGGKGGGGTQTTTVKEYSYSISLAIALGRGEMLRVGRIWADGAELAPSDLNMRFYPGDNSQLPDPKIEAVEGAGKAPAFRGTAYVVLEDPALERFGNRVPQLSFEVVRAPAADDLAAKISAVAMVPGTGEYALATTPVHLSTAPGVNRSINVNSPAGVTDFAASVEVMRDELPAHKATSLVIGWMGDDLRCGTCSLQPKVEQTDLDGVGMPWRVSGLGRSAAAVVPQVDGRPVYGGTPADASVIEAIKALSEGGREVMFYPFLLMDQVAGNGKPDPWSDAGEQPALPWRGRITASVAPGRDGSPDQTSAVEGEVAAFFGLAAVGDFAISGQTVTYSGSFEWSYRRFVLHYAHLCAAAGGVERFCIGSEMRSLTQLRGADGGFPAVEALRVLAGDVRTILGPDVQIGYAADWSEYFGYQPQDGSGDVRFHLDALWADEAIDFVGVDNYMPLADWRDGEGHVDAGWGSIYNPDYLAANIEGGEGFDWYYPSPEAEDAQRRQPITDGAHGEPWVYRYKDFRSWWSEAHYERIGGVRATEPTAWLPRSKPIVFTELGCAAVDKAANEPNKFFDPKSSESALPKNSTGARDDFMQMQYLRAQLDYWRDPKNNPVSEVYGGPMVDIDHAYIWAWDARPYPFFPNNLELWSDGGNYARGHWLNGRSSSRALASVVREICAASGVVACDVSELYGVLRGYAAGEGETARASLQPLMLAYGFDAIERDGLLVFRTRTGRAIAEIDVRAVAVTGETDGDLDRIRQPQAEMAGRVRVNTIEADGDYQLRAAEAIFPDEATRVVSQSDLPLVLTASEAQSIAERWLAEARVSRDGVRLALPPSRIDVGAGDVLEIAEPGGMARYRVDHVEASGARIVDAVRVEALEPAPVTEISGQGGVAEFNAPVPVFAEFLDLPLLSGTEVPHAPHVAAIAEPWPGSVAVYASESEDGFVLNRALSLASILGETLTPLEAAAPGRWDRGAALRVVLYGGSLSSVDAGTLLNGANVAVIGASGQDVWEVFQFASAELVAPQTYDLTLRLRGQAGTDALMPEVWPVGSRFVLLDQSVGQLGSTLAERGLSRTYRYGPGDRAVDDPVFVQTERAFDGVGLRPLAPVHLRARADGLGGSTLTWVRRTRIDGDSWSGYDVPLGEDRELYMVRVLQGQSVLRETLVTGSAWAYSAAMRLADGATGAAEFAVAQVSDRFGPGLFRKVGIDG